MDEEELLPKKEDYLLSLLNNNYSFHTVDNYRRDLEIFELFLKHKNRNFDQIDKLFINEYKGYLRTGQHLLDLNKTAEKDLQTANVRKSSYKGSRNGRSKDDGLNSRSINRMLSSLRSYLNFLVDIDIQTPVPPTAIKLIKTEKTEKQVADFDELVKLIEAPETFELKRNVRYRNRAILELLFSTGMRISEVINLDKDSIRIDDTGKKILDNKLYILGKGKKRRYVYLTERCISNLERYLNIRDDENPALFVPYRGSRKASDEIDMVRISSRYIQSIIVKYKQRLGILVPTTPHSLRHGFATYLAEQGANPAAIQRLLGHESLQTTNRYVHTSDKFAEESHRKYHPLKSAE